VTCAANYPRVARGEYPVYAPFTLPDSLDLKGLPVKAILPDEGCPYVRFDGAMFKGARRGPTRPGSCSTFFLSDESQLTYGNLGFVTTVGGLESRIVPEAARAGPEQAARHHRPAAPGRDAQAREVDLQVAWRIRLERAEAVATIVIDRPDRRERRRRPDGAGLAAAFRAFEADDRRGRRGADRRRRPLLRGADLKAVGTESGNVRLPPRRRPDGADSADPLEAGDRAVEGYAVAGGLELAICVRPAGGRGRRGVRRLLPPLGRAAHRRRHRAPARG
jgi:hypothetical protein